MSTIALPEPRLIRTSERGDFKRCPWLWYEHWIKGLAPRREPTWAWFGTAIHKALEARYQVGNKRGSLKKMLAAFDEALDDQVRRIWTEGKVTLEEDEVVDARTLGHAMLRGYVDLYGSESEWEVVHTEQPFQINVPDRKGKVVAVYAGTWDAFMRNRVTKELWLWDHKTRKSFLKDWSYLSINDQAGSYLWVAPEVLRHLGLLKKKDKIEGIVFNYLKKSMPDTRPLNSEGLATNKPLKAHYVDALDAKGINIPAKATLADLEELATEFRVPVHGEVSKVQPATRYHREEVFRAQAERVQQGQRVIGEALAMRQMLDGTLDIWKTPTEDCVRCSLFEYCQLDEQDPAMGKEFADSMLRYRDPYRDHREDFAVNGVSV